MREARTTGQLHEFFSRIGTAGGNRVKGLVAAGKIFTVLWDRDMLNKKQVEAVCDEVGIDPEEIESAFGIADEARASLREFKDTNPDSDSSSVPSTERKHRKGA